MSENEDNQLKLKVTVDASVVKLSSELNGEYVSNNKHYCSCQTEFCQCGSNLKVTETAAKQIYAHAGFSKGGREEMLAEGYRLDTIHVFGTHELSTDDILKWLSDFCPKSVEWIDDSSCNVILSNENMALRLLTKLVEPFDRRIALAAMAAVVSVIQNSAPLNVIEDALDPTNNNNCGCTTETMALKENDPTENMPATGRWFKAITAPERAICLYLRFAHKGDVKLPGAERRSSYYKRYGNPNYDNITGVLSRSFRRRTVNFRRNENDSISGDLRHIHVNDNTPFETSLSVPNLIGSRKLLTYEDLDDDLDDLATDFDERMISVHSDIADLRSTKLAKTMLPSGRRRDAGVSGFPSNNSVRPHKWPRRDRVPQPDWSSDKDIDSFREPWSIVSVAPDFQGIKSDNVRNRLGVKQRLGTRAGKEQPTLATVTLLPGDDGDSGDESRSHRLLTSLRMVADMEEENIFTRRWLTTQKPSSAGQRRHGKPTERRNHQQQHRNVWARLG